MLHFNLLVCILGLLVSSISQAQSIQIPKGTTMKAKLLTVAPLSPSANGIPMRAKLIASGNDTLSSILVNEDCFVRFNYRFSSGRINGTNFVLYCNRSSSASVSFPGLIIGSDGKPGAKPGPCYQFAVTNDCPVSQPRELDVLIRFDQLIHYETNPMFTGAL